MDEGALGEAQVELVDVPGNVQCIRINATGVRAIERVFPVRNEDRPILTLRGLPAGQTAFSGEAFIGNCSGVTPTTVPNWVADVVNANVLQGGTVSFNLHFRSNGAARITADFGADPFGLYRLGCGNGYFDVGEQCDDGNIINGDGCSSTCHLNEVEPNDTVALAEARSNEVPSVYFNADRVVRSQITTLADRDVYEINVASAGVLRLETFDWRATDCLPGLSTTVQLLNAAGAPVVTDFGSGINDCSALVYNVNAGTYFAHVEERNRDASISYAFEVNFQTSVGMEVEPNENAATATFMPAADTYIFGGHGVNADVDTFLIFVPEGLSVRAEIIEGGAESCESNGVDATLRLFAPNGTTELAFDDDSGRGFCSLIDGTGSTPAIAGAHALSAGWYYLQVRAFSLTGPSGQFDYRLVVTVR